MKKSNLYISLNFIKFKQASFKTANNKYNINKYKIFQQTKNLYVQKKISTQDKLSVILKMSLNQQI